MTESISISARTDDGGEAAERSEPPTLPPVEATGAPMRPRWRHVARLLLAPVLAMGAVGVHWWLNVPENVTVSSRDQGAKAPGKAGKKPPRKRTPAKTARPPGEIEATWKLYDGTPFEDEPVRSTFSRSAQSLVNKAAVVARKHAFSGTPEEPRVSVFGTECKTIRCRWVLRSPFPHEVDLATDAMAKLEIDGASIWLGFSAEKIDPPKDNLPKDETYVQITAAFTADDLSDAEMKVAGAPEAADTEDQENPDQ